MVIFFIEFDENGHEGQSSDGKSEHVLILQFCLHSGSKSRFFEIFFTKLAMTLSFFTNLGENSHEGPSSDGESDFVLSFVW